MQAIVPEPGTGSVIGKAIRSELSLCYTCCECTNSCPVSRGETLLDPMRIVRMVTLGLREELLASASIWLCLGCQTCTSSCGELVRGHMVVRRAQELAIEGGYADVELMKKWADIQRDLFVDYVYDIDDRLFSERSRRTIRNARFQTGSA